MTAKRNTDVVPATEAMIEKCDDAYSDWLCNDTPEMQAIGEIDAKILSLAAAINSSPELTKLIAENEQLTFSNKRMHNSLKAMYNAVYQLRGALVYINEMEEAQRILGEQS